MTQEAHHLGVGGRAHQRHVAAPQGSVDLQVEAGLGGVVLVVPERFYPVGRQVKVEPVSPDLWGGHLERTSGSIRLQVRG